MTVYDNSRADKIWDLINHHRRTGRHHLSGVVLVYLIQNTLYPKLTKVPAF